MKALNSSKNWPGPLNEWNAVVDEPAAASVTVIFTESEVSIDNTSNTTAFPSDKKSSRVKLYNTYAVPFAANVLLISSKSRSEERRVGKECAD